MTQPSPRAPLAPMQPLTPNLPYAPMQPLERMTPLQPLVPLQPGERRIFDPEDPDASYVQGQPYAPAYTQLPPPAAIPAMPPPQVQPQVVNLGLSQQDVYGRQLGYAQQVLRNLGGVLTTPQGPVPTPTRVRRPSSNKAGGAIVGAVVLLIALGAGGLFKSSSSGDTHTSIAPISISAPPISIGSHPTKPTPGRHGAGQSGATQQSGRTLSLEGTISGERIRVTFTRWANHASSKDTFFGPSPGKRYVAAQFRVTNTGSVQYVDSPANGARVIDSKGHSYRTTFLVSKLRQGRVFDAAVSLKTGQTAVGYLVFEVPKHARINRVQFSENSGYGQTATWTFLR